MKIVENLFTKDEKNNIINQKYNLLNKDDMFYEREGLFMRETKDVVLDEVEEELNFIERIFFRKKFIKVYKKGIRKGFNWSNSIVR